MTKVTLEDGELIFGTDGKITVLIPPTEVAYSAFIDRNGKIEGRPMRIELVPTDDELRRVIGACVEALAARSAT